MKTKTIEITEITPEELAELIAERLFAKIQQQILQSDQNSDEELLSTKETAELLRISPVTLWRWVRKGRIKCYGISGRRYYNKKEVLDALITLKI